MESPRLHESPPLSHFFLYIVCFLESGLVFSLYARYAAFCFSLHSISRVFMSNQCAVIDTKAHYPTMIGINTRVHCQRVQKSGVLAVWADNGRHTGQSARWLPRTVGVRGAGPEDSHG